MKRLFGTTLAISALALVAGITAAYAYDEVEVKDGGKIIGQVKFVGNPPKFDPIKVNKNQDYCGNEVQVEALIVGKEGGVKFAVAYLENIDKGKAIVRNKPADVNQKKCIFAPHVFTMVKGTDLATTNSDPVLHNANMEMKKEVTDGDETGGIQMFNFGQPKQNQVYIKKVRKLGQVKLTCDSHTHMRSYGMVFDHPYSAVTDESGSFEIDNVPPGKYTLKMWHENWKTTGNDEDGRPLYGKPVVVAKEVVVTANGTAQVSFDLK
ncbi:MAG: hypothetical protein HY786_04160 [Deltaproteobacteria bacterium]|nr:hypothetical protein [Deltaproteobacteria bacterium]